MNCPQCGGEVWNNARLNEKRANEGKKPLPLQVCKDKDGCGWVKWPPKGQQNGGSGGAARGNGTGAQAPRATRPLGPLYYNAMRIANETLKKVRPDATAQDLVAATATIFIQAAQTGAPLVPAAQKPAPPPPEPEPQDDGGWDDHGSEDGLPF